MALERFQRGLQGNLQVAQTENQLARQMQQDKMAADLNALRMRQLEKSMQPKAPSLTGDAANLALVLGRNPTLKEMMDYRGKGASQISVGTGGLPQTKGRTKADEKFAQDYIDYKAKGGWADQMKQLSQLQGALTSLESGKNITGPVVGKTPTALLSIFNPEAVSTKEAVEEVVQRNLREVLGAQFTEKEGERLISRAFNPSLSEAENAKRLRRLITQIQKAAKSKESAARYWERNGTLTGWKGELPQLDDFTGMDFGDGQSKPTKTTGIKFIGFE